MKSKSPAARRAVDDMRDLGPATDSQLAFLLPTASGSAWAHLEQIVADASDDILHPDHLKEAWTTLALRHEALRTVLRADRDGQVRLLVQDQPVVDLRLHDISGVAADAQGAMTEAVLKADRDAGADPATAPAWRVTRIDLGGGRARMVWTIHHALTDGTSIELVLSQLWYLLTGRDSAGRAAPLAPGFAEAIEARRTDPKAAQAAFGPMLADGDLAAPLPVRASEGQGRMAHLSGALPAARAQGLRHSCEASGATVLNAVQAAWALVLARWTGRMGAAFGLVESGRTDPATRDVVGCLIATLPMQVRLDDLDGAGALLSRMRDLTLQLRPHAGVTQTEIRRLSGRSGAEALYDTVVMYQRGTLGSRLADLGCGWTGLRLLEEGTALITLSVHDEARRAPRNGAGAEDMLQLGMEYDPARLSGDRARQMLDHLTGLLDAIGQAGPATPLSDLAMLSPEEQAELLTLGAPEGLPAASSPCIAARFETIARTRPADPALIDAATGTTLDFAALDRRANALAWQLAKAGTGDGHVVAVALPRGVDQIAAMLAVLKVGAGFLMLDTDQTPDYLTGLLQGASPHALIAPETSPLAQPGTAGDMTHIVPAGDVAATAPPRPAPQADRMAYVIYTSGSTGRPKGVIGLTGALSAHADAVARRFGLRPGDRVLQFAAPGFDVMLEEVWPTLLAGALVVIRDDRPTASIAGLLDLADQHRVTVLNLPASYWHHLAAELDAATDDDAALPTSLRLLVTGSERISPAAWRQWQRLAPTVAFFNAYGPTEATITCAAWRGEPLPEGAELPIGRPMDHARLILRAPDGTLTPKGGEGELWIGGAAVAGGYLGDPDRTALVFEADPWIPEGRLYRSGDRARWSGDGQLMFLGRGDRQVKLRGHRIELGQIESVLLEQAGISECFVDLDAGPPARLLAWVVTDPSTDPGTDLAATSARIASHLPAYMLPRLIGVAALPVTPNGKIDRRNLPRPAPVVRPVDDGPADRDAVTIAACMAELLDHEHVPVDADFYDLGGDSLLALRLVSMVRARTGIQLQTTDLMRQSSPQDLARLSRQSSARPRALVTTQGAGHHIPVIAVHVLGRNQALFRPLSEALGPDYPFWGLTIGVPEDLDQIDVRETARIYFEELQDHAPGQPVCLIAVSMASYFAFELARLLREAGREVPVLALLDAAGPDGRPALTGLVDRLRAHLGQLRRHGRDHLRAMLDHRRANRELARHAKARMQADGQPAPLNMEELIQANVQAVDAYQPPDYGGRITVFRADRAFWDAPDALRNGLGWASVAKGGWDLHDLPGTHLSILQPGNVEALADHMRRLIGQAEAEGTATGGAVS
ncbi:non-ribosomal peptide synthetase [Paracoccus nototheniae]|uniref:Non-ribosomal peptide synthetase n=1 Tax=Paracoccus nototheniae TaxID=2489002 RepID=A0ABW4DXC5_9RHOB|nr:non-ribosomal peptide synthetase [Paracoccus nototheniae]